MPIYTCTIAQSTFSADTKRALAGEIAHIHSSMIHVPSTYVNVAFHELAADGLYTGGAASEPRTGHRLGTRGPSGGGHHTARHGDRDRGHQDHRQIDVERVLVVIQRSPARFAVEGGRVLPEPGQEQAWLAGS